MTSPIKPDAYCDRCRAPMRLAANHKPESFPFRRAKLPKGLCANCVVTEFLYNTYPVNEQLDRSGPELLLNPLMRQAFAPILANCEMRVEEINWGVVVQNWKLPVRQKRGPRNPYAMGEYAQREKLKADAAIADTEFEDALAKALGEDDPEREESIRRQARAQRPLRLF